MKRITGSWFEFTHHSLIEGKYWNPIIRGFSSEQWRAKIREMKSLGMKYIVLLDTAIEWKDRKEAYFQTGIYPFAEDFACADPIGVLLDEADRLEMKVFLSCGFYGFWEHTDVNMTSPEVTERAFRAMGELAEKYGTHPSFYGWYLPDETCIAPHFTDFFIEYVNRYASFGRQLLPSSKMLIAPYGTNMVAADEIYVRQLERVDADFIAYQDEVGVRKSSYEQTGAYFESLRKAHDKAGRSSLWADMEVFGFEGDVYRSALIPAEPERVVNQLTAISDYVDEVLIYQYMGMMNQPGTISYCGHPDSLKLYQGYSCFLKKYDL